MIAWTNDTLTAPEAREITGKHVTPDRTYRLVHDTGPNRWYITCTSDSGVERTVVYGSRNAPALKWAWNSILATS